MNLLIITMLLSCGQKVKKLDKSGVNNEQDNSKSPKKPENKELTNTVPEEVVEDKKEQKITIDLIMNKMGKDLSNNTLFPYNNEYIKKAVTNIKKANLNREDLTKNFIINKKNIDLLTIAGESMNSSLIEFILSIDESSNTKVLIRDIIISRILRVDTMFRTAASKQKNLNRILDSFILLATEEEVISNKELLVNISLILDISEYHGFPRRIYGKNQQNNIYDILFMLALDNFQNDHGSSIEKIGDTFSSIFRQQSRITKACVQSIAFFIAEAATENKLSENKDRSYIEGMRHISRRLYGKTKDIQITIDNKDHNLWYYILKAATSIQLEKIHRKGQQGSDVNHLRPLADDCFTFASTKSQEERRDEIINQANAINKLLNTQLNGQQIAQDLKDKEKSKK